MGCDIHIFIEYKHHNKWHADKHSRHIEQERGFGRNYLFFGTIAGVRSHALKPIYPKRGVPPDATDEVRTMVNSWGDDAHSHTYLSMNEYKTVIDAYNNLLKQDKEWQVHWSPITSGDDFYSTYESCKDIKDKSHADALLLNEPSLVVSDCRLIIFFDS